MPQALELVSRDFDYDHAQIKNQRLPRSNVSCCITQRADVAGGSKGVGVVEFPSTVSRINKPTQEDSHFVLLL
jgi:hypothetical protein